MMRQSIAFVVVSLMGVYGAAYAEPVIEKSLAQLNQSPPAAANAFDFIVTGDSQSNRQLVFQTDAFKGMIQEWNVLRPDLVLEVGDLILGGSADGLPQQWDLFEQIIAACKAPYFPVPGNHDISDALSEQLWKERMGPTRYAFTYGNSRFIVLDSEEVDALDRLSDDQVAWFKQELETTKASNIFVFLHQPYFTFQWDPRKTDEIWQLRWKYLADIMHGHPVRAVFAGHIHGYRDFGIRDGVHYVICGGAASLGSTPDETGRFGHYLLVRVRDEDVSWSVIKAGSVVSPEIATNDRISEVFDVTHRLVACEDQDVPYGQPFDRQVTITILNPFDKAFDSSLAWDVPKGWNVEPAAMDYHVDAQGKFEAAFHIRADGSDGTKFPVPVYKTCYVNAKYGPPVDVSCDLPLVPVAEASKAKGPVTLDGVLDEWKDAAPFALPYYAGFGNETPDPADLKGQCRIMWDADHLYVAFEIDDNDHVQPYGGDIVWLADDIEFGINTWQWSYALTPRGPQVFLYRGEEASAETVNTEAQLAVKREGGRTVFEGAFPPKLVKPMLLAAGSDLRFRVEVADVDNARAKRTLLLTPGGESAPGIRVLLTNK